MINWYECVFVWTASTCTCHFILLVWLIAEVVTHSPKSAGVSVCSLDTADGENISDQVYFLVKFCSTLRVCCPSSHKDLVFVCHFLGFALCLCSRCVVCVDWTVFWMSQGIICHWLSFAHFSNTNSCLWMLMLKHASHPSLQGVDKIKSETTFSLLIHVTHHWHKHSNNC